MSAPVSSGAFYFQPGNPQPKYLPKGIPIPAGWSTTPPTPPAPVPASPTVVSMPPSYGGSAPPTPVPASPSVVSIPPPPPPTTVVTADTSPIGASGSITSVSFVDANGNSTQVPLGGPVPAGYKPFDQNAGYTYTYFDLVSKVTVTLPYSAVSPGTWVLKTVNVAKPPDLSKGDAYTTSSGDQIIVPSGSTVPVDWKPVSSVDISQVVLVDTGDGIVVAPAPPQEVTTSKGYIWKIVGGVIGVIGIGGVAWLGYLAWNNPEKMTQIANELIKGSNLIISVSQMLVALAVIAALSFVAWEFFSAMDANNGDVGKAIGSMLASVIETFVKALVDAVEILVKDAWDFVWGEVKSIIPSWL